MAGARRRHRRHRADRGGPGSRLSGEPALSVLEPVPSSPAIERDNPFKGLAYYEKEDAGRFTGRQRDIEAVANGILRTRTFVVYGRSGLGKTSLLLAGVFPRLATQGCQTLAVRLLQDPLDDLKRALLRQTGLEAGSEVADLPSLIERAGRGPQGQDRLVVIVFDQFEEFFVRFADQPDPSGGVRSGEELDRAVRQQRIAQRQAFVREIGTLAADSRLNLRLVFSLREDWIAEMSDFSDAVPEITHHMFRLLPLTSFGVRQVVVETLRAAGTEVDSRLVSALVDTLAEVHFDPVVLQVLCSEVWERARARAPEGEPVRLEPRDLECIGGVRQVFRGYLDQVTAEIDAKDLRRKIHTGAVLDALISERRTKLAVSRDALLQQSFAITGEELDEVLDRLVRHRLVRSDPRGGVRWFELVHERLIGAILEWFETDLDFFKFRGARNLVLNSCRNGGWKDNPELLLNRGQLDDTVGPFKDLLCFSAEERLFLVSSAVYAHSRDLEYWADLAGDDTSADLIDRFLDQAQNERLRRRAAEAAGRVAERPEHFAARCLNLALHDPAPVVRQAAGRSFADLAGEHDYQTLAERLKEKKIRSAALDVLVEALDKEKIPSGVKLGRFRLGQARRRLEGRRVDEGRSSMQMRGLRGLQIGLGAALSWSATAGLIMMWILVYEMAPEAGTGSPAAWPIAAGIFLLFALPLGLGAGWYAARRAALMALRRGREGLSFQGLLASGPLLKIGLPSLLVGLVASLIVPALYLLLLAIGLCGLVLPAALVPLALPAIQSGSGQRAVSRFGAWTWAFGGSLAPFLLAVVVLHAPFLEFASLCLVVSALFGGLMTYSGLLAVALTSPETIPAAGQHRLRRALGPVLALSAAVLLLYVFGWDSLPFLAHRVILNSTDISVRAEGFEQRFPAESKSVFSNAYHLQLTARDTETAPRFVQVSVPLSSPFYQIALQPGESRRLAFNLTPETTILIKPDRPLSSLPPNSGQLVVARLTRKDGIWSGPIPGLEGLRKEGKPLVLAIGNVVQGGEWCEKAELTLALPRVTLHCDPRPQKIIFDASPISWDPRTSASVIELRSPVSTPPQAGDLFVFLEVHPP